MTRFEVGREYHTRSLRDFDCIFSFVILARTEQTVTITAYGGEQRRKIRIINDVEVIDPLGKYSMSPVLRASNDEKPK